jgi:hypothetical protein
MVQSVRSDSGTTSATVTNSSQLESKQRIHVSLYVYVIIKPIKKKNYLIKLSIKSGYLYSARSTELTMLTAIRV